MRYYISDLIGYLGVAVILLTYFLLQAQKINQKKYLYSWLNLIGATFILYSLYFHWNWPSVVIELAWILISGYGILRIFRGKREISRTQG